MQVEIYAVEMYHNGPSDRSRHHYFRRPQPTNDNVDVATGLLRWESEEPSLVATIVASDGSELAISNHGEELLFTPDGQGWTARDVLMSAQSWQARRDDCPFRMVESEAV